MTHEIGPVPGREDAQRVLAAVFGSREHSIVEGRHCWACRPVPHSAGNETGLGQGAYVIDKRTGIITVHGSLALPTVAEEYDAAAAAGLECRHQVVPQLRRIRPALRFEDDEVVIYGLRVTWLDAPDERHPPRDLEILKAGRLCDRPAHAVADWAYAHFEATGSWPRDGVIAS